MAYDQALAQRVRAALQATPGLTEVKMFGGICFMVAGNMAGGVINDSLMVRVGTDARDAALAQPHARLLDMTGRTMKGWVLVEPAGIESDADLTRWIGQGVAYAQALPPK